MPWATPTPPPLSPAPGSVKIGVAGLGECRRRPLVPISDSGESERALVAGARGALGDGVGAAPGSLVV